MTIRVLLADDQAMVRTGLRMILDAEDDIIVVGEAASGAEVIEAALRGQADVVLMDIRMPHVDGIAATERILGQMGADGPQIIVITTFDTDENVFDALRAGASGFLLKDATAVQLTEAVRVVARGDALLSPSITRRLLERCARRDDFSKGANVTALQALTDREREVYVLVAKGLSNAEIASRLMVGTPTVKTHVSNVLLKLGLRDRVQLVIHAYESGALAADAPEAPPSADG